MFFTCVCISFVFPVVYLYIEVYILYVHSKYILKITIIKCHIFTLGGGVADLVQLCDLPPVQLSFLPT